VALHLTHALKAYPFAGVLCILGWGLVPGGSCEQSDQLLNTEDGKERGVWSTLVMEEGTCWYVGEGWEKSRGLQRLKQVVGSLETVGIGYHFYR